MAASVLLSIKHRNCPDVTILNSLVCLCFCCLLLVFFVVVSFVPFVSFLSLFFAIFVFFFLVFLSFVFLSFCLFVFLSGHHCDHVCEGSQVSNVTLCVKIQTWHWVSDSLTHSLIKVRYIELQGQLKTGNRHMKEEDFRLDWWLKTFLSYFNQG